MPLFPEAAIAAAKEREKARDADLCARMAATINDFLHTHEVTDQTWIPSDKPHTVAVELIDGTTLKLTVTVDNT